MNLRELKEIFRLVEKTDFTEVEVSQGDFHLKIERGKPEPVVHAPHVYVPSPAVAPAPTPPAAVSGQPAPLKEPAEPPAKAEPGFFVTSPFVGTFYRSSSPDSPAYVEQGQTVKKGQVLCIVEAMKLMNEIESDYDGRVAEIYVQNGQPVEFGSRLFRIEPL